MGRQDHRPLNAGGAGQTGGGAITARHAAAVYALLTIVCTWPQAARLTSIPDYKDAYFSVWRMAWVARQLPRDPLHLFDANIFYPLHHALAFSDAVLLEGLLGAPLIWLGLPAVVVYNLAVLGSFVACGLGTFLLVRSLTGRPAPALLAGLVFAFAPFRFDHYYHLELLWAQWMPLSLWMLQRAVRSGRTRDGVLAGVFFALQGLSCIYYAVFFATTLAAVLPLMLWAETPAARRAALRPLAAAALFAVVPLIPYALPYASARSLVGERQAADLTLYSVGPKHYVAAMPSSVLYGSLTGGIGAPEKRQFVGFVALALAALSIVPPLDRRRLAYLAMLALTLACSFGHRGLIYPWLRDWVVVYHGLRVPARFGHLVVLAVAVLAGYGAAGLLDRVHRRRVGTALTIALGAMMVLEYLVWPLPLRAVPTTAGPAYEWLGRQPDGAAAELPYPTTMADVDREAEVEYRSTFHWKPMINGYSGFYPDASLQLQGALAGFPAPGALAELRRLGVSYLIVREDGYGSRRYREVLEELKSLGLEAAGPFGASPAEVRIFKLSAAPARHPEGVY